MKIMVQKYGGTSVAGLERMKRVLSRVRAGIDDGYKMVVVLSAMSGETNKLLGLAKEFSPNPDKTEMDALVVNGGKHFRGPVFDAGQRCRIKARSVQGWQIPIVTNDAFMSARIDSIDSEKLKAMLEEYDVVVVAGFQGRHLHGATDHPGARRIGHHRRGSGRGPRGRGVRNLHRRRRRLHHRPQHVLQGPQAEPHFLRRDDRAGQLRGQGASDTLGGVRQEIQCSGARALHVHRRPRHAGDAGGCLYDGRSHGFGNCLRQRPMPGDCLQGKGQAWGSPLPSSVLLPPDASWWT